MNVNAFENISTTVQEAYRVSAEKINKRSSSGRRMAKARTYIP